MALKEQFARPAVWDKKKTSAMEFLQSRKFTGTTNLSLEAFLGLHRSSYIMLQRCADHVNCQLPNERSRVQFLLDNIQVEDSTVKAALSSIRMDDTPNGMRNNFEMAVTFLLPTDPVDKKKNRNKRPVAEVLATDADAPPPKKLGTHKSGIGKTGVEFRYYKPNEFKKLSKDQKDELMEHRRKNNLRGPNPKNDKKRFRASINSVLKSALKDIVDEQSKKDDEQAKEAELQNALMASLKALRGDGHDEKGKAEVSSLSPATAPKKKSNLKVGFKTPPDDSGPEGNGPEVAVAKLMRIMKSLSSGRKGGSP